jgi:Tripartite tricarboxylate transporter family receptor
MAEAGIQNFVMDGGWYGMFAPARTPAEIIDRLDSEVKAALTVPSVRENYAALGLSPVGSSPAERGACTFRPFSTPVPGWPWRKGFHKRNPRARREPWRTASIRSSLI